MVDYLMPTYCYSNSDGVTIERFFHMKEDLPKVVMDYTTARETQSSPLFTRDYSKERKSLQTETSTGWPMEPCVSSGVDPSQAQELRDHLKKHGVPTEVTPQGDPIYRTPTHQKRALACRGMHNKAAI